MLNISTIPSSHIKVSNNIQLKALAPFNFEWLTSYASAYYKNSHEYWCTRIIAFLFAGAKKSQYYDSPALLN